MLPKRDGRSDRAVRGNSTCSAVPEGVDCVRDDDWPLREGRVLSGAWDLTPVSLTVAANIGAVAGTLVAREIGEGVATAIHFPFCVHEMRGSFAAAWTISCPAQAGLGKVLAKIAAGAGGASKNDWMTG